MGGSLMDSKDDKARQFLEICKQCDGFFKEILDMAIEKKRTKISDEAAFYLLGMLRLGLREDPHFDAATTIKRYEAIFAGKGPESFRDIGDSALIITGIWWQSLSRKLVSIDFYIELGRMSYQREAERQKSLAQLFEELSENFDKSVNILMEATRCISEASMTNRDIMRIYEVWLETHNTFLEEKLRSYGINLVNIKAQKQ